MMKFLFCRMEEPKKPAWRATGAPWHTPPAASELSHQHPGLWQSLWAWHNGIAHTSAGVADQASINGWISALQAPTETARLDAVYALGQAGSQAVPALIEVLYAEAHAARAVNLQAKYTNPSELYAGYALAAIGAPAIPALNDALGASEWWVRASAAGILGDIGQPAHASVPALSRLLTDEVVWVRRNAAEALGTIGVGAQAAVPALAQSLLHDENERVRHNAALALARVGPGAQAAVPALQAARNDADLYVKANAAIALQRLASA
jgi:HEAT repeat protein